MTWKDMALWRSGRSMVTRATAPSTSYRTCSIGSSISGNESVIMGRMSFFFVTVALALGVALVTGGSLGRISTTELRHPSILAVAVGIQLALEVLHPTSGTAGHLASALLVVSYVLLLLFCAANLRLRGLAVVAVGIALNGLVITLNQGMPIRAPEAAVETTTKHHAERP